MSAEIVKFHYGPANLDLRSVRRGEDLWFVAADLAKGLGYRDAFEAGKLLDDDERGTEEISTLQNNSVQQVIIFSEPGLYKLVARSRKPEARAFDRWVRHEVLPTLRRTGSYSLTAGIDEEAALTRIGGIVKAVVHKLLEERIPQEIERLMALREAEFLVGHRHVATNRVSALDCVIEWGGTEPKGRRSPTRKVGNVLRRLCNGAGIPIIRCDRTGVDLFPYEMAHKYMCEDGHKIVKEFMDSRSAQGVLQFPDRRLKGAYRAGKRA